MRLNDQPGLVTGSDSPPLVVSEAQVDRLVSVATEAIKAATGA